MDKPSPRCLGLGLFQFFEQTCGGLFHAADYETLRVCLVFAYPARPGFTRDDSYRENPSNVTYFEGNYSTLISKLYTGYSRFRHGSEQNTSQTCARAYTSIVDLKQCPSSGISTILAVSSAGSTRMCAIVTHALCPCGHTLSAPTAPNPHLLWIRSRRSHLDEHLAPVHPVQDQPHHSQSCRAVQ